MRLSSVRFSGQLNKKICLFENSNTSRKNMRKHNLDRCISLRQTAVFRREINQTMRTTEKKLRMVPHCLFRMSQRPRGRREPCPGAPGAPCPARIGLRKYLLLRSALFRNLKRGNPDTVRSSAKRYRDVKPSYRSQLDATKPLAGVGCIGKN